MSVVRRRALVLGLFLALLGAGAFWATSSLAARTQELKIGNALPKAETIGECEPDAAPTKIIDVPGEGTFQMHGVGDAPPMVAIAGKPFISKQGLKTVPLRIIANGGHSFAEGIGETRFWLDATRPVQSAIWEKAPGTEFPAIQEMRFHFFFTMESKPGKLFRTMNPSIMRSDNVLSFPPPPGTVYRLMQPIDIEDVNEPGVVAVRVLSNQVVIRQRGRVLEPRDGEEL